MLQQGFDPAQVVGNDIEGCGQKADDRGANRARKRHRRVPPLAAQRGVVDVHSASRQAEAPEQQSRDRERDAHQHVGVAQGVERQVSGGGDRSVAPDVRDERVSELVHANRRDPGCRDKDEGHRILVLRQQLHPQHDSRAAGDGEQAEEDRAHTEHATKSRQGPAAQRPVTPPIQLGARGKDLAATTLQQPGSNLGPRR